MDITEDMVKSVTQKRLRSVVPCGMDSDDLQRLILKFGEDTKKLHISVECFVDWLTNKNPPWPAYHSFMPGCLIKFDKQPGFDQSV